MKREYKDISSHGVKRYNDLDISVTMDTYTHLGFDDAKDEMVRLEELEAAKKEVGEVISEKPISQKMFKAI